MLEEADTIVDGGGEVAIGGRDRGPGDGGDGGGGELEELAEDGADQGFVGGREMGDHEDGGGRVGNPGVA